MSPDSCCKWTWNIAFMPCDTSKPEDLKPKAVVLFIWTPAGAGRASGELHDDSARLERQLRWSLVAIVLRALDHSRFNVVPSDPP